MPSVSRHRAHQLTALLVSLCITTFGSAAYAGGLGFLEVQREGVGGVDGVRQADAVAVSPDGAHVYVAGRNDDAVAVFSRGPSGALTFVEREVQGSGGVTDLRLPTGVLVATNDAHVYVTSALDNAVVVFSRNTTTGALTFVESKRDGAGGVTGLLGATDVAMSPDGLCVYATGQLSDAVAVFSRNVTTGALTFVERQHDGTSGVDGLAKPTAVAVSPDGAHLYATGGGEDAVAVFSRNMVSCALTFVEAQRDGTGGVDGLSRSTAVAVSPDGANVYVTGEHDNAVASFARNGVTGALTFLAVDRDGKRGVKGIKGAQSVVVTPDGSTVYVAGEVKNGVGFFHRDAATGVLEFFEPYLDGKNGFDGLDGVFAIALSPDGKHLYSAARGESAVGAFTADTCGNGTLGPDEQCDDANVLGGDGCSATCRLELCPPVPQFGCAPAIAHGSLLSLKDVANPKSDRLSWSWRGGPVMTGDLGDPLNTTDYLLCLYDSTIVPQPRLALAAPHDGTCGLLPCWSGVSGKFRYRDRLVSPDGISDGSFAVSSEKIKAKGGHVFSNVTAPPPLPLAFPLTVQLVTSDGFCWDSVFSSGTQTPTIVKAKSD